MRETDLDDFFSENPSIVNNAPNNQPQGNRSYGSNNSYSGNNSGYQGGGQGGFKGGGGRRFQAKEVDLDTFKIYKPVAMMSNQNAPDNIVNDFKALADILVMNQFVPRITTGGNVDDALLKELNGESPEIYIPWKDFNNINSKFYFNDKVSQHVAKMFHRSYDTLKPAVQAFLARNVRQVMGEKVKSYSLAAVIWTQDGAEEISEVTPTTGNMAHVISVARAACIPVFNLGKPDAKARLIKYLRLKRPTPNQQEGTNP